VVAPEGSLIASPGRAIADEMGLTRVVSLMAALVLAAACLTPVTDLSTSPGEPPVTIWVLDHGWHTALAVRRADVDRALWPAVDDFPASTFIEVAWGDRDFYMATPATMWMAIKAAFGARGSVLHIVGLDALIPAHSSRSEIVELRVSRRGFDALTRFVSEEHQRNAEGQPVRLQPGLYGSSWFYIARSRYSLFNTCNTWIARALQTAGLPVTPSGVITAGGLMQQLTPARAAP
jgi:uncharacterized protein (TIGR02117 family)